MGTFNDEQPPRVVRGRSRTRSYAARASAVATATVVLASCGTATTTTDDLGPGGRGIPPPSDEQMVARIAAQLDAWPQDKAKTLARVIAKNRHDDRFAVFDADNTLYRHDLTEALLAYLEHKKVITRESLDPSLRLIPFKDTARHKESLFGYYYRLCEISDEVCYPWIAQSFAGLTVGELKKHIDAMLADGRPIPTTYDVDGVVTRAEVTPPKIFLGMQQLVTTLKKYGINVYAVSAANEEAVRSVVSDRKYGFNIAPQNVIGVSMLLKNPKNGDMSNARDRIADGNYRPGAFTNWKITPYLWSPATWYEGKAAAISTYIARWEQAVIIAGDTPVSDGPMLFRKVDVKNGGHRIFVDRKKGSLDTMNTLRKENAAEQKAAGLTPTADDNWLVVKPDDIQD